MRVAQRQRNAHATRRAQLAQRRRDVIARARHRSIPITRGAGAFLLLMFLSFFGGRNSRVQERCDGVIGVEKEEESNSLFFSGGALFWCKVLVGVETDVPRRSVCVVGIARACKNGENILL